MTVGCDCYGNKIRPLLNIIDKLENRFNLIKITIEKDKIDILKLICQLVRYHLRNTCAGSYKIMIPVKYLCCNDYNVLTSWMTRTQWTKYYPTTKSKKNISDVIFGVYDKPLSGVNPGTGANFASTWENIFYNSEYIVVINSDMIDNLTNEYKQKG